MRGRADRPAARGAGEVGGAAELDLAVAVAVGDNDNDVAVLDDLLAAEYRVAPYTAGAGILQSPPSGDRAAALVPHRLAVETRFAGQHQDHANALVARSRSWAARR